MGRKILRSNRSSQLLLLDEVGKPGHSLLNELNLRIGDTLLEPVIVKPHIPFVFPLARKCMSKSPELKIPLPEQNPFALHFDAQLGKSLLKNALRPRLRQTQKKPAWML